jgi:hypothetical protein
VFLQSLIKLHDAVGIQKVTALSPIVITPTYKKPPWVCVPTFIIWSMPQKKKGAIERSPLLYHLGFMVGMVRGI